MNAANWSACLVTFFITHTGVVTGTGHLSEGYTWHLVLQRAIHEPSDISPVK